MKITVTTDLAGERLDKFLSYHYPEFSRSRIQKLIKSGEVTVNGEPVSSSYRLKQNETILLPSKQETEEREARNFREQKDSSPEPEIITETRDHVVVNKPAGLISHRAPHIKEPALTDFLLDSYPDMAEVGEDEWRPGLLHRLDREVSGLLVAARNQESFYNLKEQFQDRKIKKEYTALVHGVIEKEEGELDFPIKRSDKGFKMAALPRGSSGDDSVREAKTRFWVMARKKNFTLLKVRIFTGRTHQIRIHLSAFGHPVVGDGMYGHKKTKIKDRKMRERGFLEKRIFLVADVLGFKDLDGEEKEFSLELPRELREFRDSLK